MMMSTDGSDSSAVFVTSGSSRSFVVVPLIVVSRMTVTVFVIGLGASSMIVPWNVNSRTSPGSMELVAGPLVASLATFTIALFGAPVIVKTKPAGMTPVIDDVFHQFVGNRSSITTS